MTDSPSVDDELSTRIARSLGYTGTPTPAEFASAIRYLDAFAADWEDVLESLIADIALLPPPEPLTVRRHHDAEG